jgi:hypothetical protein
MPLVRNTLAGVAGAGLFLFDTGTASGTIEKTTETVIIVTPAPQQTPRRGGLIPRNQRTSEEQARIRDFQARINAQAEAIRRGEVPTPTTSTLNNSPSTTSTKTIPAPINPKAEKEKPSDQVAPLSR